MSTNHESRAPIRAADQRRGLFDLAARLVFYRGNELDVENIGLGRMRLILAAGVVGLLAGVALLSVGLAMMSSRLGAWGFGIVAMAFAPLLIVAGILALQRALSQSAYQTALKWIGRISRGLAMVVSLIAVTLSCIAIGFLAVYGDAGQRIVLAVFSLLFAAGGSALSFAVADSSRAFVRADRSDTPQWDAKLRTIVLWLTLLVDVWVALQLADRIERAFSFSGIGSLVVIIAAPLVFAYVNHRSDVRRRLGILATLAGELQAAAGKTIRQNASAEAKALLRVELVRLQTFVVTNREVRFVGARVRGLIDREIVMVINHSANLICSVPLPPGHDVRTREISWLRDQLAVEADSASLAKFAEELRRRALVAIQRY